jgi:hypothetical protein
MILSDTRRPEGVIDFHGCKGNRPDRIILTRNGLQTSRKNENENAEKDGS